MRFDFFMNRNTQILIIYEELKSLFSATNGKWPRSGLSIERTSADQIRQIRSGPTEHIRNRGIGDIVQVLQFYEIFWKGNDIHGYSKISYFLMCFYLTKEHVENVRIEENSYYQFSRYFFQVATFYLISLNLEPRPSVRPRGNSSLQNSNDERLHSTSSSKRHTGWQIR